MESLSQAPDGLKRRKSSIENDIMAKRLQAWREKKGLPTVSKFQEEQENRKRLPKNITRRSMKRKPLQVSKSEVKTRNADVQSKPVRFHTPGPSTKNNKMINRRPTCNTLQGIKQPVRRSLAPSTNMNTPHQPPRSMKSKEPKMKSAAIKATPLLSKPQQAPILKSHDQSHDVHDRSHDVHSQRRKSVRFLSPKTAAMDESVEESNESTPACSTPCGTPAPCITPAPCVTPAPCSTPTPSKKLFMKQRLEEWLLAKGKTPSRFQNFLGYESTLDRTPVVGGGFKRRRSGTPHLGKTRREDTPGKAVCGTSGEAAVHTTMQECLEMLEEGCPLEDMSAWLDGVVTKVPLVQRCAGYWLCRAKIAEKHDGERSAMECLFEAVGFNPEPTKDILDTLATYRLKLKMSSEESTETDVQSPLRHTPYIDIQTPQSVRSCEERARHQSSDEVVDEEERVRRGTSRLGIKFCLKETTPYFARIHQTSGQSSSTPSCLLVTPVRRSARLDNKRRSVACVNGNQMTGSPVVVDCLDSVQEVAAQNPLAQLILRPNRALSDEFTDTELSD